MEQSLTQEYSHVSLQPLTRFLVGTLFVVTILLIIFTAFNAGGGLHIPTMYAFLQK